MLLYKHLTQRFFHFSKTEDEMKEKVSKFEVTFGIPYDGTCSQYNDRRKICKTIATMKGFC